MPILMIVLPMLLIPVIAVPLLLMLARRHAPAPDAARSAHRGRAIRSA